MAISNLFFPPLTPLTLSHKPHLHSTFLFSLNNNNNHHHHLHHHSFFLTNKKVRKQTRTRTSFTVTAQSNNNNNSADYPDRIISAACYFYPFFDGIQYGRYVITQFAPIQALIQPLVPAIKVFKSFPFNGFLVFLTLYFVVVRNSNFSRYVRFNTMQAIVLDVLLIFPDLLERTFNFRDGVSYLDCQLLLMQQIDRLFNVVVTRMTVCVSCAKSGKSIPNLKIFKDVSNPSNIKFPSSQISQMDPLI